MDGPENPNCGIRPERLASNNQGILRVALPSYHIQLNAQKPPPPSYPRELKTIGDHLRKRRLDLGLLQREVSERLDIDETTICNWEINCNLPQIRFIPQIIAFLGYDPHDENPPKDLAQRIILTRRRLGMTQKELAQHLGIDVGTLGRWERGIRQPTKRLAQALNSFLARTLSDDQ